MATRIRYRNSVSLSETPLSWQVAHRFPGGKSTRRAGPRKNDEPHTIAALLGRFDHALNSGAPPGELSLYLDGLSAILESHFQYEERRLLDTLSRLELHADPRTALGPL
jgi:hypothetical protein